jgi:hypothetical protein
MNSRFADSWLTAAAPPGVALPPPNPFIPDSLAVLPNGKSAKLPYEVRMTVPGTRLWYKQDDTFRVPKLNARCAVQLQLAARGRERRQWPMQPQPQPWLRWQSAEDCLSPVPSRAAASHCAAYLLCAACCMLHGTVHAVCRTVSAFGRCMLLSPAIHRSAKAWVSAKVFNRLLNEAVEAQLYQVRPSTTARVLECCASLSTCQNFLTPSARLP